MNLSDLALLVRGFSSERIAGAMLARASIAPAISGEASGSGLMGALGLKPFYDQCSVPIRAVSCSIANCDPTPDPGASMIALCFKLDGTSIGIRFGGAFEREWVSLGVATRPPQSILGPHLDTMLLGLIARPLVRVNFGRRTG